MSKKGMRKWKGALGLFVLWVLWAAAPVAGGAELAVIVHQDNALESVDQAALKKIMLGQKQRWDKSKDAVTLALLKTTHPIGQQMVEDIYHMKLSEYKRYWPRQIFAMKCKVPHNFNNEAELIEFVAQTPGAIGVVCACTDRAGVKTLRITAK